MRTRFAIPLYCTLLMIVFVGCTPDEPLQQVRWSAQSPEAMPEDIALALDEGVERAKVYRVGKESVHRWHQKINDVELSNAWTQAVLGPQGEWAYVAARRLKAPTEDLTRRINELAKKKESLETFVQNKYRGLREAKHIYPSSIAVETTPTGTRPVLRLTYVTGSEDDVIEISVGANGELLSRKSVAFSVDGIGQVFPKGPVQSSLTEVVLKDLTGNGTLSTSQVKVESALGPGAFSPDHDFRFPIDEAPFTDVQSYYYTVQALDWFQKNFNFSLPFYLTVRVHIGGAQPSNAAFYYRGAIRLGDGDGVTYKNIGRDPTIVMHEVVHAVIDALSELGREGESLVLSEGFADFFAAAISNNPNMGSYAYLKAPYRRTLENNLVAYKDFSPGTYHNSTVVSGTFWDAKKEIGAQRASQLALATLIRLGATAGYKDFESSIKDALHSKGFAATESEVAAVKRILTLRGWN